jgi:hypothetical protein
MLRPVPHASRSALWALVLVLLLAAPAAWADLFGGDIPLLGTLVTQGSQQLSTITQLLRTANAQLTAAKQVVGYADEAKAAFQRFQTYSLSDFGDDVRGLSGGAVPVSEAERLVSGIPSWAPATGELRTLVRRCLGSEGTGSSACTQMREAVTQADAREALGQTFGRALHPETAAADVEAARGLAAADAHAQEEAARALASGRARRRACGQSSEAGACGLAQAARAESQLDTVNAQLSEATRLSATALALRNAERKRALLEAAERRQALGAALAAPPTPGLDVQGAGVLLVPGG